MFRVISNRRRFRRRECLPMFSIVLKTTDPELGRPKSELDAGSLPSLAESCVKEFLFFDLRVLIKNDRA